MRKSTQGKITNTNRFLAYYFLPNAFELFRGLGVMMMEQDIPLQKRADTECCLHKRVMCGNIT
jgi:hypothetical protein